MRRCAPAGVVGDHITDVATLPLTGTAEANSAVKVYDGATLLGSAATDYVISAGEQRGVR